MASCSLLVHPHELSKEWIDRMVKNKIPTIALHPVGGPKSHENLKDLVHRCQTPEFRSLIDYAYEKGLTVEYEMHAMSYLLPRELFDEKPEWFRVNKDGVRSTDWNCCSHNEEALDYIAERAAELAKALYRSTDRYFFWLDDSRDSACYCDNCKDLTPSEQQMKVLNHILKRLKKDNENASLAYLAYFECIEPPVKVKPEKDIFLEYAPFDRDYHAPIEGNKQGETLTELLKVFGKDTAKVLDYWYDNSLYSNYTKPPKQFTADKDVVFADFKYYRKLGFSDLSSFACYFGDDYTELYGEVDITDFAKAYYEGLKEI